MLTKIFNLIVTAKGNLSKMRNWKLCVGTGHIVLIKTRSNKKFAACHTSAKHWLPNRQFKLQIWQPKFFSLTLITIMVAPWNTQGNATM